MDELEDAFGNYHVPVGTMMLIGVGVLIALHLMGFRFVFEAGAR